MRVKAPLANVAIAAKGIRASPCIVFAADFGAAGDGRADGGLNGDSAAKVGLQWTIGRRVSVTEAMPATRDGFCAARKGIVV